MDGVLAESLRNFSRLMGGNAPKITAIRASIARIVMSPGHGPNLRLLLEENLLRIVAAEQTPMQTAVRVLRRYFARL